jgi:hypothetical protein
MGNPQLPLLTLQPTSVKPAIREAILPRAAAKAWDLGGKALIAGQWSDAERLLREVARAVPQFAPAWTGIGMACHSQQNAAGARPAYQQAITADPAGLQPRLLLARLELGEQRWAETASAAEALIRIDTEHRYPEGWLLLGVARYQLKQLDAAQAALLEAVRLDSARQLPQAEYFLGAVLAGKGDRSAAAARLRAYLDRAPSAPSAESVREQLAELTASTGGLPLAAPSGMLTAAAFEPEIASAGQAWVPGGRRALAAVARMQGVPSPENFFLEYGRTVAAQTSRLNPDPIAGYAAAVTAFVSSVAELTDLGERREGRAIVRLSLVPESQAKTQRILALLGWRSCERNGKPSIEPGDQPADGPRQHIPPALGIDELAMRSTLEAGRVFEFEILSETAPLSGGTAWGATLEGFITLPGGIAEAFIREPRLAKTYAGLASMGAADGLAFARRAGLRALVATHSDALWQFGGALRLAAGQVVLPGGAAAESLWTKLAGVSPRDPMKFFEAVLTVDRGRLAAFYAALMRADAAHQQFFTRSPAAAHRYYAWYRDSEELREGINVPARAWRADFFRDLPLENKDVVYFPGGRSAWSTASTDEEALMPTEFLDGARVLSAPLASIPKRCSPPHAWSATPANSWRPNPLVSLP